MDKKLLEILACPACYGNLKLEKENLTCLKCKKTYLIKEGIPLLKP